MCRTHLTADTTDSKLMAARRQRLQGIEASLALDSTAESREDEIYKQLQPRVGLLAKHGMDLKSRNFNTALLYEIILLVDADKKQLGAAPPLVTNSRIQEQFHHMCRPHAARCMISTMHGQSLRDNRICCCSALLSLGKFTLRSVQAAEKWLVRGMYKCVPS